MSQLPLHTNATNGTIFQLLQVVAQGSSDETARAADMIHAFRHMENHFYTKVHPVVDLGLNLFEALSVRKRTDAISVFTFHGPNHIQRVIRSLDSLVKGANLNIGNDALTCVEAYILLCAAHVHDVGNVYGRSRHERYVYDLVVDKKDLFYSDTQIRQYICNVASAHGGKHPQYLSDTIRPLREQTSNVMAKSVRLPLLAALLRLADELSENEDRVPSFLSLHSVAMGESALCQAYAQSFEEFDLQGSDLFINFGIWPELQAVAGSIKIGSRQTRIEFPEYMEKRLLKLEMETRYCSQYGRPQFNISCLHINIQKYSSVPPSIPGGTRSFTIPLDFGYPQSYDSFLYRSPELGGVSTFREYITQ